MKNRKLRKRLVVALAATIIMPMLLQLYTIEVRAVGSRPSITAFASKEQLTTSFDLDGTTSDQVAQAVYFGKNSSGDVQEWYIAGKDSETGGLVLMAASPLVMGKFNAIAHTNKTYSYAAGTGYGDNAGTIEVYANHYGVSDLLGTLKTMETDTTYFSSEEQALMQNTTVKTRDIKNSITYTITGKLYAPMGTNGIGSNNDNRRFNVGSDDSLRIELFSGPYSSGTCFWLRAAYSERSQRALRALPGNSVLVDGANGEYGVSPAFSMNLASVLFAATTPAGINATSVSGDDTIAGKTMVIRYDASEKLNGSVAAYASEKIKVKPAEGVTVTLVVQGNDGSKDWYYATPIDSEMVLTAESIQTAAGLGATPDMKDCEIWIETMENNLAYAKMATPIQEIGSVSLSDIDMPIGGQAFDTTAACVTTGVDTVSEVQWELENGTVASGNAEYQTVYKMTVTLIPKTEYVFSTATTAKVGDKEAECSYDTTTGALTITYICPATDKEKLISITAPSPITGIANRTDKTVDALGLPDTVGIVTEDNSVIMAEVIWDLDNLASGSYDPAILTEQTFTVNGIVKLPESIDGSGMELKTQITITVAAAGITGAPTASPVSGTYAENQKIALTSSTEDAVIYYTLDGSEPTRTATKYTTPIEVKGEAGKNVTTTIRAMAVKEGMQDSEEAEFTYVIQLPETVKYTVTVNNGTITAAGSSLDSSTAAGNAPDNSTGSGSYEPGVTITVSANVPAQGQNFKGWRVEKGNITLSEIYNALTSFLMPDEDVELTAEYMDEDNSATDEDNPAADTDKNSSTGIHNCSFEWKITKQASSTQDGEKIYYCITCGNVTERRTISSYDYFNKEIKKRIEEAPENGIVEVNATPWISYVEYVLKALEQRSDVTLVTTFRYQGKEYCFTIPARKAETDRNILVEEDVKYYGFLYLSGKYGMIQIMDE